MVAVNRPPAVEDVGVLGEEAEDQPGQKVVHILPARRRVPVRIVLQQLDIEPVEAARGLDVKSVFADLLDGGDAGQRQEEAEMVREVGVGAGDGLAITRFSASKLSPSVARMNLAFVPAVAGLAAARRASPSLLRRRP